MSTLISFVFNGTFRLSAQNLTSTFGLFTIKNSSFSEATRTHLGQVAQLVEQRTENPRVGGSIPSLATIHRAKPGP